MPMFHYEASDATGKALIGTMDAPDEATCRARLTRNGYKPQLIEAARGPRGPEARGNAPGAGPSATNPSAVKDAHSRSMGRKSVIVPLRELSQFYRQMGSMTKAGVALPQAITQMQAYTKNGILRKALADMEETVARGRPLSEAMDRHPRAFSPGHIGLIRSGEGAGFLDRAFEELANQSESDWGVQSGMKFNPLLFLIKLLGIPFLVAWLVFMAGLPAWQHNPGLITSWLGRAALAGFGTMVAIILLLPALGHAVRLTPLGKMWENFTSVLPGMNARRKRVDRVKAVSALASALTSGVPLGIAWELSAEAADSDRFQRIMREQLPAIRRGGSIPEAMNATGLFTPQMMQMAHSGEMSGNLPEMLTQATVFEREEARAIGNLMPWVIAALAYFLFLVVAGYFVVRMAGTVYGGMLDSQ